MAIALSCLQSRRVVLLTTSNNLLWPATLQAEEFGRWRRPQPLATLQACHIHIRSPRQVICHDRPTRRSLARCRLSQGMHSIAWHTRRGVSHGVFSCHPPRYASGWLRPASRQPIPSSDAPPPPCATQRSASLTWRRCTPHSPRQGAWRQPPTWAEVRCGCVTAYCSLCYYSLLTFYGSLLTAYQLTNYCSLLTAHCARLSTAHYSLLTTHHLPPATYLLTDPYLPPR